MYTPAVPLGRLNAGTAAPEERQDLIKMRGHPCSVVSDGGEATIRLHISWSILSRALAVGVVNNEL